MLQKKRAVVTGASGGIGRAMIEKLLEKDWCVEGMSRTDPLFSGAYRHHPIDFLKTPCVFPRFDVVDLLVVAHGRGLFGGVESLGVRDIQETLWLNLGSVMEVVKAYVPDCKRRGEATIVLIGSESAQKLKPQGAVYSATKAGLQAFGKVLRQECAPRGVRVILVHPGLTHTEFFAPLHFYPVEGLDPQDVACCVMGALEMPHHVCVEEVFVSPLKNRVGKKRPEDLENE